MILKVGIISDTHGCFDDKLRKFLDGVDEIWHAGDFGDIATFDAIEDFKPLKGVYGNVDGGVMRRVVPEFNTWEVDGSRVLMTHIGGYPGKYDPRAFSRIAEIRPDYFITGHSHILKVIFDKKNNLLHINPGAAGNYGFHTVRTAIRAVITQGKITDLEIGEWARKQ